MDNAVLKKELIQRIIEIDEPQVLKALQTLLSDDNIEHLMERLTDPTTTENFNDYIKEWVKNM